MSLSTNILGRSRFALWLIELRKGLGLTQEQLAEKANKISEKSISEAYIGVLEDKRNPADATLKKLIALAKALEISPIELVNRALDEALNPTAIAETSLDVLGAVGGKPEETDVKVINTQKRRKKTA